MTSHQPAAPTIAPYGSWRSTVTPDLIVAAAVGLGDVWLDGADTWWSELRPQEGGRVVIVRQQPGAAAPSDVLAAPWSARTRVHEYGGGAWWVDGGTLFFANWSDQRLYSLVPGGEPVALTAEPASPAGLRYADGRVSPNGQWIVCVRERHDADGDEAASEAANEIVSLPVAGGNDATVLFAGADFVAAPRLSPDGRWLCWLAWHHPHMPWDGTELWVARFEQATGTVSGARKVAGGLDESIVQPEWAPDGRLYYLSDRSNWWNLYRFAHDGDGAPVGFGAPLPAVEAEIGVPAWVFGRSRYGFLADGTVVCAFTQGSHVHLGVVDDEAHVLRAFDTRLATFEALRTRGNEVVGVGGGFASEPAVVAFDLSAALRAGGADADHEPLTAQLIRPPRDLGLPAGVFSPPEPITFPTSGGRVAHAWFYPPHNPAYAAPVGEAPPLLVLSHGGPTAAASPTLNLSIQFWTSRGFAVVDVDYGGSTGYGRAYRKLLDGQWGIVDVDDCCAAATWLATEGRADPARLAIRGGSAGGFTTLAALCFRDTFAAGASHFGVADLAALAEDTHKFESRYLDGLVGPYPAAADRYRERSPIHHTEGLSCPLILFQGLEDMIVPPAQSQRMAAALATKSIPHAYLEFEGEQHGFRKAENIVRCLTAELYFYAQVFGFVLGDPVEGVDIVFGERLRGAAPQ